MLQVSASLLVSSGGGGGSQSHQSWFCSEFMTEVLDADTIIVNGKCIAVVIHL